jgi:uncharacterized membrane protein
MWHVWKIEEVHTEIWWRNLRDGDYLEDLGAGWVIILIWIFQKFEWTAWIGLIWLQDGGQVAGCCEHGNEHSDSIKYGELLNYRRNLYMWLETDPVCSLVLVNNVWVLANIFSSIILWCTSISQNNLTTKYTLMNPKYISYWTSTTCFDLNSYLQE